MRAAATCLTAALLLAACTTPEPRPPEPSPTRSVEALPSVDPDAEALAAVVEELRATITALRDALERAQGGDAAALAEAAALLAADVPAVTGAASGTGDGGDSTDSDDTDTAEDAPAPLLPGPETSRLESVGYGDVLTRALARARGAGGTGEPVQRLLADPLAGDLGSWQRAPDDLLRLIGEAAANPDLDSTQTAVLQLDGEAPRALAWVAHGLIVPDDASASAGRALAHLAIIELALEQLQT